MDAARRLALRLHALHEADRTWLLQQLENEQRNRLTKLLDEIDALGLEPNDDVLAFTACSDAVASVQAAEAMMRIGAAPGIVACQILRSEPTPLRRYLMGAQRWPWLSELDPEQMAFIQGGADVARQTPPVLTPRAHGALMHAFAARITETDAPPVFIAVSRPSLAERIWNAAKWPR